MTDLIHRLRYRGPGHQPSPICLEAADEIERLCGMLRDVDGYLAEGRCHHARYMIAVTLSGTEPSLSSVENRSFDGAAYEAGLETR